MTASEAALPDSIASGIPPQGGLTQMPNKAPEFIDAIGWP